MANSPQSLQNHARIVPLYHGVAFPIIVINLLWSAYRAFTRPSWETVLAALMGVALVLLFFFARIFALTVQDRVIRLEMRLRLREVLPPDLATRISEFTTGQLVALRFASDRELPGIARRVLDERLQDKKVIKALVQDWQADHLRA
jgi:hypothetical protein